MIDERNGGGNRPESSYDEGADFWGDAARQRRRGRRSYEQPGNFAATDGSKANGSIDYGAGPPGGFGAGYDAGPTTGFGAGYDAGSPGGFGIRSAADAGAEVDTVNYAPLPLGKKRRPIIRNFWLYTLSFAVPFLLVAIAFVAMQFYPIGDRTPLTVDLYHQYAPFMSELRYKILNGESLLYSWHGGLGMNFLAVFTYYLASPLNALLLVFPISGLAIAIILLIVIKIGLMGLFMGILLHRGVMAFTEPGIGAIGSGGSAKGGTAVAPRRRLLRLRSIERAGRLGAEERNRRLYEREVDTRRGHTYLVIVGATLFALSGFMMAYFWDVMWLDSIYLLPLVILGVILLVRKGNLILYPIAIASAVAVNYYIGFFVALFTALFFISYLIYVWPDLRTERSRPIRIAALRIFQFVLMSALAAGITAFLSLPTWMALQMTSAAGDSFPKNHKFEFTVLEFMTRHLISMKPSIRDGLPNIYAGLISLLALPLYVFNRRIRLREKVASLSLLAFLFLSFNSNYLNFIWHGLHYPNQLPYRYSFLYSFVLVIIAVRALMNLRYLKKGIALGA
ncbi:MAG: YfhO family protein, partial [Clostridiaceae bacterium]|nr:YfhO family protein [Clostridiaceae bacterium]